MRTNLKKRIAAVFCAAAAAFTSFTVLPTDAAEKKSPHITVLGDSLGTNYNLGSGEYGYSDYIADYLKAGTYSRFARNGYTTVNLLEQLESDSEVISAVKDSDLILVTVGSNDMLNALKEFVATNAEKGESFKDYALRVAKSGQQEAEDLTFKLNRALRTPRNDMLDNLKQIDKNLHEMNPDATVVFQKLYNPFESKTTVYNGKDYSEQYQTFIDYLRGHFKQINNGIENLTYGVVTDRRGDVGIAPYAKKTAVPPSFGSLIIRKLSAVRPETFPLTTPRPACILTPVPLWGIRRKESCPIAWNVSTEKKCTAV